ncbi:hypothetical protein BOVA115_1191 [Bacteroides ovatus]|nr:hypothetical protein BOVA115_1191 [Bacteroides ovatus]
MVYYILKGEGNGWRELARNDAMSYYLLKQNLEIENYYMGFCEMTTFQVIYLLY